MISSGVGKYGSGLVSTSGSGFFTRVTDGGGFFFDCLAFLSSFVETTGGGLISFSSTAFFSSNRNIRPSVCSPRILNFVSYSF